MQYSVQFGTLNAPPKNKVEASRFRIAVMGDFSGRGNSGAVAVGGELAKRKPLKVNSENIDDILERFDVKLHLPAGPEGAIIEVPLRSMDDFHPDQLYESVPLFERLMNLRAKLQDPASFDKAAAALRSLAMEPAASASKKTISSTSTDIPRKRLDSLGDLLQQTTRPRESSDLKSMLRNVVGPHVVSSMEGQEQLLAAVDESLSELMCTILHHPDFQALESLWRSIDLLVHRLEIDHELEIVLYDITAAEVAADLASNEDLQQTGLFSLLVEQPNEDTNQGPISLVVGNYVFEKIPPHAELLARMAQIAANGNAAFVASIAKNCIDVTPSDEVPAIIAEAWSSLAALPHAAYVALTTPRFMLRWPYGKKTEPIDSFEFEEFSAATGLKAMLWGNSAILAGLLIGQTYRDSGVKDMKLGSILTIDDIPFYYYTDQHGDQVALPCTERMINERLAKNVSVQKLVPVLSLKGANEVRLGGFMSLAGSPLAGPWAPISAEPLSSSSAATTPSAASDTSAAATDAAAAPAAAAEADDDLDNLLADLDDVMETPPDAAPAATPDASADAQPAQEAEAAAADDELDELDSLLAGLDADDDAKATASEESDMDSELQDLLNDL